MSKIDHKKTLDSYKASHNKFRILQVPKMQYLMIDGHGDPNTSKDFTNAITTLYPVAYKIKFASKQLGKDYVVPPLEGLWWAKDMATFTTTRDKSKWDFTLMLMQPDWITNEMFLVAKKLAAKTVSENMLNKLRLETLDEGLCVQTLHIGSFDDESEILKQMHNDFIPNNNLKLAKKHHEIYLSDFRKVAADKLKTILRQPVTKI